MGLTNELFGEGPVTEKQFDGIRDMELATSDMVWAGVIFRWGFLGLFLFALLNIFSVYHAFKFYMNSEGLLSELSLFFLIYIISTDTGKFFFLDLSV